MNGSYLQAREVTQHLWIYGKECFGLFPRVRTRTEISIQVKNQVSKRPSFEYQFKVLQSRSETLVKCLRRINRTRRREKNVETADKSEQGKNSEIERTIRKKLFTKEEKESALITNISLPWYSTKVLTYYIKDIVSVQVCFPFA